jgi:hypothetical protein
VRSLCTAPRGDVKRKKDRVAGGGQPPGATRSFSSSQNGCRKQRENKT